MKPYGLILAGGGAKGAYQIGAWKAMLELGVEIQAIAGTSIGAINGALIAQGDYDKAVELWSNAEVVNGVNIQSELKSTENLFSFSNLPQIFHEIIKNGGIDVTPARQMVEDNINEKAVRASGIPLGIVTFQLNSLKPVEMFVDEMPEGQLVDYLMASARFPGLSKQGPDDSQYLDGGIYDNAPVGILRKRGINRLIVVDISNMKGIGHKEDWSCADIVYIRPYNPKELGESFEFDKSMTDMRMEMGYLDAKKAFGILGGINYYFSQKEYKIMLSKYGWSACSELEKLAEELEVPRLKIYTHKQFMKAIIKANDERTADIESAAEVITGFVPSIFHESREKIGKKFKSLNRLHKAFEKAYEAIDKFKAK